MQTLQPQFSLTSRLVKTRLFFDHCLRMHSREAHFTSLERVLSLLEAGLRATATTRKV